MIFYIKIIVADKKGVVNVSIVTFVDRQKIFRLFDIKNGELFDYWTSIGKHSHDNTKSIIFMALLISVFTTIISMYNAFITTDKSKIILMRSFGATKLQLFTKLVLRGNTKSLVNTLKINISLSLIGVIMGELLVSKKGLGYLITYGSQVFNLNLVITSIFILGIMSYILYILIDLFEKKMK